VASGQEALYELTQAAVEGKPYDAVLIDAFMPGMTGFELAASILSDPALQATPLVMLTAFDSAEQREQALALGIRAYLTYPLDAALLQETLLGMVPQPALPLAEDDPGSAAPDPFKQDIFILVAEDNLTHQSLIMKQVRRLGYGVRVVSNGIEVVDEVLQYPGQYALILMDIDMPVMDGLRATELIREHEAGTGRHIPILATTANAVEGARERCLSAGMDAVLTKPLNLKTLHRALGQWLVQPA
jgi:CheY-like chemotaxis protein